MLFSSLIFLYAYLPIVLMVYYSCPKRYRNGCLFLVSLIFYGWQEPLYIGIMLLSTIVDYMNGHFIYRYRAERKIARRFVIFSIIFNLSLLGFFKYYTFLANSLFSLFNTPVLPMLSITLPVGISFYTFQTMSYPIDVYRNEVIPESRITSFGMYVTMFPQLVAGPIVRYKDIATQIKTRMYSYELFYQGIMRFLCGLAKKVLIANPIGSLWEIISQLPPTQTSMLMSWLGIIAFALQLYFDFSGYSNMAIGLGKMLGFHLPENFHYPYLAKSMREFWQRWHMTLGTWFRSYVYIPLGGSHHGIKKTIRNLLIVWLLTGLWHGAGWNFIIWGLYCGIWIIFERMLFQSWLYKHSIISHAYFIIIILIGWVFFANDSLTSALTYLTAMFNIFSQPFINDYTVYLLGSNLMLLCIALIGCTHFPAKLYHTFKDHTWLLCSMPIIVIIILFFCTAGITADTYNPFLYFRF